MAPPKVDLFPSTLYLNCVCARYIHIERCVRNLHAFLLALQRHNSVRPHGSSRLLQGDPLAGDVFCDPSRREARNMLADSSVDVEFSVGGDCACVAEIL